MCITSKVGLNVCLLPVKHYIALNDFSSWAQKAKPIIGHALHGWPCTEAPAVDGHAHGPRSADAQLHMVYPRPIKLSACN